jgi:hypothetical protein
MAKNEFLDKETYCLFKTSQVWDIKAELLEKQILLQQLFRQSSYKNLEFEF